MGGFETALNRLGGKCVLASEIDKFANQAYELLYGMETVGDITKIKAEDVPDHDLLTAGFPCQAFSVAGKRLGFEDTRGTLFFEVARIAKVKQPKVLLLENVKGLINHGKGKTFNTIIQTLCDIGYTVDFEVLNSKYFGVPQNRERVFIVAVRDDLATPEPWIVEGNTVVPKGKRRIQELEGVKTFNFDWPPQEQVTKRLRDILEDNVDERFYLSEEKTAKLVEQLTRETKDGFHAYRNDAYDHIAEEIRPVIDVGRLIKKQSGRRFKEDGDEMFALTVQDRHGIVEGAYPKYSIRKLTPLECFRLQAFPDEYHEILSANGISNSQLYKMAGNAVTVSVIDAIGKRLIPYLTNNKEVIPYQTTPTNYTNTPLITP